MQASITLEIDIASIEPGSDARLDFENQFSEDMAAALGIDSNRIQIRGVTGGSVDRAVSPPDSTRLVAPQFVGHR